MNINEENTYVGILEGKAMGVTTSDIAKKAGVSQTTVSLVLNNNTKIAISSETWAYYRELELRPQASTSFHEEYRSTSKPNAQGWRDVIAYCRENLCV